MGSGTPTYGLAARGDATMTETLDPALHRPRARCYRTRVVASVSLPVDRRPAAALSALLLAYLLLIASHRGEFWPFSVFPMFASAGKPWARALVVELDAPLSEAELQREHLLTALPGAPFPLARHGVQQHDASSLVQRVERWSDDERAALARLFGTLACERPLLVLRVRGTLEGELVQPLRQCAQTPSALDDDPREGGGAAERERELHDVRAHDAA